MLSNILLDSWITILNKTQTIVSTMVPYLELSNISMDLEKILEFLLRIYLKIIY